MSAKAPGRPVFDSMINRIERGEAEGILCWHPDRLARNSVDGGRIIYLLDQGRLKDLKFSTFTFENNSQGKFMLQINFGYSKYYVDTLSENVKRGNKMKISRGWRPNQAPLGYLNERDEKTIVKDPERFSLLRRIFDLMLSEAYSAKDIALLARDEWGLTTPRKRKRGGRPIALSSIYHLLGNPFYAGLIPWNGEIFPGKHEPVISIDEFERVQRILGRPYRPRPQVHTFAFTGMIRCGACGLMVTAEKKIHRKGYRYTYYHCTKRRIGPRCTEPSVNLASLESQIAKHLESMSIPAELHRLCARVVLGQRGHDEKFKQTARKSNKQAMMDLRLQLDELTTLRLKNFVDDEEFLRRKRGVEQAQVNLERKQSASFVVTSRFETLEDVLFFRNRAIHWFSRGDDRVKRLIVETCGSKLALQSKLFSLQARKPFVKQYSKADITSLRAISDDVRDFVQSNPEEAELIHRNVRLLREMCEKNPDAPLPSSDLPPLRDTGEPKAGTR